MYAMFPVLCSLLLLSVPGRCWLGVMKSIRPVKIEWWGVGVVICLDRGSDCLHMVQLMPLSSQTPLSLPCLLLSLCVSYFGNIHELCKNCFIDHVCRTNLVLDGGQDLHLPTRKGISVGVLLYGDYVYKAGCAAACCRITRTLIAYISLFSRGLMTTWLFAVN